MKIKQQTLYKVFVKLLVNSQMLEVQADTDFDKLDGSFGEITGIDEEWSGLVFLKQRKHEVANTAAHLK